MKFLPDFFESYHQLLCRKNTVDYYIAKAVCFPVISRLLDTCPNLNDTYTIIPPSWSSAALPKLIIRLLSSRAFHFLSWMHIQKTIFLQKRCFSASVPVIR